VQVLPAGMLFTVWVPFAARFNVTLGPDGKQETVTGKFVPAGNGIVHKFFTVLITVREPDCPPSTFTSTQALLLAGLESLAFFKVAQFLMTMPG
jgi:hypothetical protein